MYEARRLQLLYPMTMIIMLFVISGSTRSHKASADWGIIYRLLSLVTSLLAIYFKSPIILINKQITCGEHTFSNVKKEKNNYSICHHSSCRALASSHLRQKFTHNALHVWGCTPCDVCPSLKSVQCQQPSRAPCLGARRRAKAHNYK